MKGLLLWSLFFIELFHISFSWKIPPKDFLNDFANHKHCYSSTLYLPGKHAKGFEWTKSKSNVKIVYHENVVGKNLTDIVSESQELHVLYLTNHTYRRALTCSKLYIINDLIPILNVGFWTSHFGNQSKILQMI